MALASAVKKNEPSIGDIAFIQKNNYVRGDGYVYLCISRGFVKERYLYNPDVFYNHKNKNMASELWHGDKIPSFNEIKKQAIIYKMSEQSGNKDTKLLLD